MLHCPSVESYIYSTCFYGFTLSFISYPSTPSLVALATVSCKQRTTEKSLWGTPNMQNDTKNAFLAFCAIDKACCPLSLSVCPNFCVVNEKEMRGIHIHSKLPKHFGGLFYEVKYKRFSIKWHQFPVSIKPDILHAHFNFFLNLKTKWKLRYINTELTKLRTRVRVHTSSYHLFSLFLTFKFTHWH